MIRRLACSALLAIAACRGDPSRTASTLQFRLLDTLVLQETAELYLGNPDQSFTVDDKGFFYLSDDYWGHTIRYRPDGAIDRVFGKAGDGPGEFRSTTPVAIVSDSTVVLASAGTLKVFDRDSGKLLFSRRLVQGSLKYGMRVGNNLYFAFYARDHGLLTVPVNALSVAGTVSADLLEPMQLALPPEYSAFPGLRDFAGSAIAVWNDSILAGFSAVDYLVLTDSAGSPIDSLDIPRLRRKGTSPEAYELYAPGKKELGFDESVAAMSHLFRIWRLPDGRFLIWYQQNRGVTVGANSKLTGRDYLTLLSKDRKEACVDGEIPFPGSEWPRFGLHGDTLLALDQVGAASDATRSISVIRRYVVSDSGCTWLPVKHRPVSGRH